MRKRSADCRQALQLKPDFAEAHCNLGNALRDQGKLEEAINCYRQALHFKPDFAQGYSNLGNALRDQGKLEEAITSCRQALQLKPDFAEAYSNLGYALKEQGNLDEAINSCQQALRFKPDFADVHFNLAMLLLLAGDFSKGWPEYEWRWQSKHLRQDRRHFPQPLWQGNSLRNSTILLHAEQGLGDTIQFIRFAALVKERVGTFSAHAIPSWSGCCNPVRVSTRSFHSESLYPLSMSTHRSCHCRES